MATPKKNVTCPEIDWEKKATMATPKKKAASTWPATWLEIDWPTPEFPEFPDSSDFPPMEWPEEKGEENEPVQAP